MYKVYENEEGGLEIIDNEGRRMLLDVYAYDSSDAEREVRMEWIADALNATGSKDDSCISKK